MLKKYVCWLFQEKNRERLEGIRLLSDFFDGEAPALRPFDYFVEAGEATHEDEDAPVGGEDAEVAYAAELTDSEERIVIVGVVCVAAIVIVAIVA